MKKYYCNCRSVLGLSVILLVNLIAGCSSDDPSEDTVDRNEGGVEVSEGTNAELNLDSGNIGLVIDTREISRKGYMPKSAMVEFGGHSKFNETLEIDPLTNLAILSIANDSLTDDEKSAFAKGVQTTIKVTDESEDELTIYEEQNQVLDDSNRPLSLTTDKDYIKRPLLLKEEIPYLLQVENIEGVVTSECSACYKTELFVNDSISQQFYFEPTGEEDVYRIRHFGYEEGSYLFVEAGFSVGFNPTPYFINFGGNQVNMPNGPSEFVFEQDDDGWSKIRLKDTNGYLYLGSSFFQVNYSGDFNRFRIITDNINWAATDQGTEYLQPITPPAQLDFAYNSTLKNCSSALVTQTIGKADSRTRTTEFSTSESLQLFSSETVKAGIKLGVEVGASVGADVPGVGNASVEVKASAETSLEMELTTAETTTSENTISTKDEYTSSVSSERTVQLDPYTSVEAFDAIKTVKNVITPFVQTVRISGSYKGGSQEKLTGPELVTQMKFNFVEGIISEIGSDYVDVTLRGQAVMDQVFQATTEVKDLPGGCGN